MSAQLQAMFAKGGPFHESDEPFYLEPTGDPGNWTEWKRGHEVDSIRSSTSSGPLVGGRSDDGTAAVYPTKVR